MAGQISVPFLFNAMEQYGQSNAQRRARKDARQARKAALNSNLLGAAAAIGATYATGGAAAPYAPFIYAGVSQTAQGYQDQPMDSGMIAQSAVGAAGAYGQQQQIQRDQALGQQMFPQEPQQPQRQAQPAMGMSPADTGHGADPRAAAAMEAMSGAQETGVPFMEAGKQMAREGRFSEAIPFLQMGIAARKSGSQPTETAVFNDKRYQFNPSSGRYDIELGSAGGEGAKPSTIRITNPEGRDPGTYEYQVEYGKEGQINPVGEGVRVAPPEKEIPAQDVLQTSYSQGYQSLRLPEGVGVPPAPALASGRVTKTEDAYSEGQKDAERSVLAAIQEGPSAIAPEAPPADRIGSLMQAQNQARSIGTESGRKLARDYQDQIQGILDQGIDSLGNEYVRAATQAGVALPLKASDMPRINQIVQQNRAGVTGAESRAREEAQLEFAGKQRIEGETARELGVPLGTTWNQIADRNLDRIKELPPSAEERNKAVQIEVADDILDRLAESYDPSLIGPVQGRWLAIKMETPPSMLPSGITPLTQQEANLVVNTQAANNIIVYARSGAQINEQEAKRMRREIPQITDNPIVFEEKMAQTRRNFAIILDRFRRGMKVDDVGNETPVTGGSVPKPAPAIAPQPPPRTNDEARRRLLR